MFHIVESGIDVNGELMDRPDYAYYIIDRKIIGRRYIALIIKFSALFPHFVFMLTLNSVGVLFLVEFQDYLSACICTIISVIPTILQLPAEYMHVKQKYVCK